MCSVVGYIGKKTCKSYILEGLKKLEYRGYDSAGFACLDLDNKQLTYKKAAGELINLLKQCSSDSFDGYSGIGHTRWATHGQPDEINAHPQIDCKKNIAVVHNGIIENYQQLKDELISLGHILSSQTDTEVIAHLLENKIKAHSSTKNGSYVHSSIKEDILEVVKKLEGAYAFIALIKELPDTLIAVRKRSPLCIGVKNQEVFVASDMFAFTEHTDQVLFMPDESIALISADIIELYNFKGITIPYVLQSIKDYSGIVSKKDYKHFMLKEIYEQKDCIKKTLTTYNNLNRAALLKQLGVTEDFIKKSTRINLIGCGTSWHAASIAQFFFESLCNIPTSVLLASEFRHKPFFYDAHALTIAITQSGETADTLEGIRFVKHHKMPTIALTNVLNSSAMRECDGFLLTHAGKEIAVASTKAFTAQLASLYILAHFIALEKELITVKQAHQAYKELLRAADILESSLENYKRVIELEIAPYYNHYKHALFLGRHISYPFAQEAALKLKEITYIFTDCYPAGELKHGSIALVDNTVPVFIFSTPNLIMYKKLLSNAQEVKARKGILIVFAFEGQEELIALADTVFIFPLVSESLAPIAMAGVMQFFAYAVAQSLGRSIDKPRNLAKSVTVE